MEVLRFFKGNPLTHGRKSIAKTANDEGIRILKTDRLQQI